VPAEDAVQSIPEFARQAGVQIVAPADKLKGVRTQEVRGDLEVAKALQRLLAGTPLEVAANDGAVIVLKIRTAPPGIRTPAAATDPGETTKLAEVVVVGDKVERTIQKSSTSVAYLTAGDIENSNADIASDLFNRMVNVNGAGFEGTFVIRGVIFDHVTGAGFGELGTEYLDGVRLVDRAIRYGPDLLWDVNNIDVLRGAQSTLQGRNSLAGAIYITSNDPTYTWQESGQASYASGDTYDAAATISGPIIDNRLAFRATIERYSTDGFISDPVLHSNNVALSDQLQGRLKLRFDATPDFSVNAVFGYSEVRRHHETSDTRADSDAPATEPLSAVGINPYVPTAEVNSPYQRISLANVPEFEQVKTYIGGLNTKWLLGNGFTFTAETTYLALVDFNQADADFGYFNYNQGYPSSTIAVENPLGIGNFASIKSGILKVNPIQQERLTERMFTEELRLKFGGERLRGVFGVYFAKEKHGQDSLNLLMYNNVPALVSSTAESFGLPASAANAVASLYTLDAPVFVLNSAPVEVTNYAAYAEGDYELTKRLTLTFGLRYDAEHNVTGTATAGAVYGLTSPSKVPPPYAPLVRALNNAIDPFINPQRGTFSGMFGAWLPKAGVRYRLGDDISVGASVQRGYRAGSTSIDPLQAPPYNVSQLQPEYTWTYEVFWRQVFMGGRARFNANVYFTDWTDQQVNVFLSQTFNDFQGYNAGHSQLYGFESEAQAKVTPDLSVHGGVGYSHTEFLSFDAKLPRGLPAINAASANGQFASFVHDSFPFAPPWTVVLGADWKGRGGVFASGAANYQARSFSSVPNVNRAVPSDAFTNSARTLVDLRAGWERAGMRLSIYVRNALGKNYLTSADPVRPTLGDPRAVGVSFQFRH
jgi:outer membrane receptor protein involved in Fe transport